MSDIGPALPPHLLAKRKRQQEQEEPDAATTSSGAKQPSSPENGEKRRRVIGPAMPPAPLNERPSEPAVPNQEDSSGDEDDFGPAPPSAADATAHAVDDDDDAIRSSNKTDDIPETTKRDEWMMMPPKQDDLAARMDPSKQRARGFNTGKGAKAPSAGGVDNSAWHETPEQKRKRLQDEMMGISQPSAPGPQPAKSSSKAKDEAAAARIREHTEKTRGPSLLEKHQGSSKAAEEDDPSKRAFDREKDMGSGMQINQTQRKEMLNKAGGFSSKFSGGSYL